MGLFLIEELVNFVNIMSDSCIMTSQATYLYFLSPNLSVLAKRILKSNCIIECTVTRLWRCFEILCMACDLII